MNLHKYLNSFWIDLFIDFAPQEEMHQDFEWWYFGLFANWVEVEV